jgi:RND family efflux transporter MFP subunit
LKLKKKQQKSDLELAKINYDRTKSLFDRGSETQSNLDKDINALDQAKAQLNSFEKQIKAQEKTFNTKQAIYKEATDSAREQNILRQYYDIKAPFDGKIGYIPVKIGDYVNSNTVLTSITENNHLELKLDVNISEKDKLKNNLKINIIDDNENILDTAHVWFISPKVNEANQTITVNGILDNDKKNYKAGELVKTAIVWEIEKKMVAPTEAVVHLAGQDYVFVVKKDKDMDIAMQVPVHLGKIAGDNYVINKGIKEEDQIVISGVQKLRNNTPVMIQNKGS